MYSELEYSSQLSTYYLPIFTSWSKADTQTYPQKMNRLGRTPTLSKWELEDYPVTLTNALSVSAKTLAMREAVPTFQGNIRVFDQFR